MNEKSHTLLLICQSAPQMSEIEFYRFLHQNHLNNKSQNLHQIIIQKTDILLFMVEGSYTKLTDFLENFKKNAHFYNVTLLTPVQQHNSILKEPLLYLNQNSQQAWRYSHCFEDTFGMDVFKAYPKEAYKFINNIVKFVNSNPKDYQPEAFKDAMLAKIKASIVQTQSAIHQY